MKHVMFESSVIRSAGYDAENWVLEIKFPSNEVYRYYRVPSVVFIELTSAPSAGEYFNENIKELYECLRVHQEVQA